MATIAAVILPRLPVDFNSRDRQGRLRVRRAKVDGLATGRQLIVYDPDDDTECDATLVELDERFAYIEFDADSARSIARWVRPKVHGNDFRGNKILAGGAVG